MQQVALLFYIVSFAIGVSSILNVALITFRTRNTFLGHYLGFAVFYTLLIGASMASLYMEVNFPALFEGYSEYSRFFIFLTKCGLVYTLIAFTDSIFAVPGKKIIELAVFIALLGFMILRLVFLFKVIPEDVHSSPFLPSVRIMLDALIILALLYLFILRIFRFKFVMLHEFQELLRLAALLIALFSPGVILEVIFYDRWGFTFFSPAMYCAVSLAFMIKITGFFLHNYRVSETDFKRIIGRDDHVLDSFMKKHGISKREEEVIVCLLKGDTNKAIAESLFISGSTVKAHIYNIFKKTSVQTRYQLLFKIVNQD